MRMPLSVKTDPVDESCSMKAEFFGSDEQFGIAQNTGWIILGMRYFSHLHDHQSDQSSLHDISKHIFDRGMKTYITGAEDRRKCLHGWIVLPHCTSHRGCWDGSNAQRRDICTLMIDEYRSSGRRRFRIYSFLVVWVFLLIFGRDLTTVQRPHNDAFLSERCYASFDIIV